MGVKV